MRPTHPDADVLLLWPPYEQTTIYQPYSAPYWLAGYLGAHGVRADVVDLNRACLGLLLDDALLSREEEALAREIDAFEEEERLGDETSGRYFWSVAELAKLRLARQHLPELLTGDNFDRFVLGAAGLRYTDLLGPIAAKTFLQSRGDHAMEALATPAALRALLDGRDTVTLRALIAPALRGLEGRTPLLVGITVAFAFQLLPALLAAGELKRLLPGVQICLGGPIVSLCRDFELESILGLGCVDACVRFAGEEPLLELVRQLQAGRGPRPIRNVVRAGTAGRAPELVDLSSLQDVRRRDRARYQDRDRFRFPDDVLARMPPGIAIPVFQSRGCYWGQCSFCDYIHLYGANAYVPRDERRIVDDLAYYADKGYRSFHLITDSLPPAPARKIAHEIIARGLRGVRWQSFFKVDQRWDLETLCAMREAGYHLPQIGVEAVNTRLLTLLQKGYVEEDVHRLMSLLREARFGPLGVNMILDPPTATFEEALASYEFCAAHRDQLLGVNFFEFVLTASSEIASRPDKFGIQLEGCQAGDRANRATSLPYRNLSGGLTGEEVARLKQLYASLNLELQRAWAYDGLARGIRDTPEQELRGYAFRFCDQYIAGQLRFGLDGRARRVWSVSTGREGYARTVPEELLNILQRYRGRTIDLGAMAADLRARGMPHADAAASQVLKACTENLLLAAVIDASGRARPLHSLSAHLA